MDNTFLTVAEVIEYLQVTQRTVYRLLKAGRLPAVRVGRQWRFRRADLDAWLQRQGAVTPPPAPSPDADIPARRPERPQPLTALDPRPEPGPSTPRVLVVDDEESIRDLLARTLALVEYEVSTRPDAASALECLRAQPCDLLITDLKMPGMDGLELIREVRRMWPALPVLIITGYSSEANAIAAINLGVNGYLTKPFRVPKVLSAAAKALGE